MKTKYKLLLLAMTLVMASACANKQDDGGSSSATGPAFTELHTGLWVQPYNSQQSYVTSPDVANFERAAVDLARTGMKDANSPIGGISNSTGVILRGKIFVDAAGLLIGANSNAAKTVGISQIQLVFEDQYVKQGYSPIDIRINGTAGHAKGGNVDLTFADDKGSIWIRGTYDVNQPQGYINGTVSYQNAGQAVVTLGQFRILTCGFIDCSQ